MSEFLSGLIVTLAVSVPLSLLIYILMVPVTKEETDRLISSSAQLGKAMDELKAALLEVVPPPLESILKWICAIMEQWQS